MTKWVCFLLLHNLQSSPKIMQPRQYVMTFCLHFSAAQRQVPRSRACLKKQDKAFTFVDRKKKERKKNSYITRGIKGPVYSFQVALSGGAAYKESYLVIFLVNQTCSRSGSFWCGRKYSFYKQGPRLWVCSQASLFLSRHVGLIHWMPQSSG